MGLIGRVLSFVRAQRNGAQISDTKLDPGGNPNRTAEHFAPPGDDSYPLEGDYTYAAPTPQSGRVASLGYIDPNNTPKAQKGEKRIYARDSGGAVSVDHWLKADGSAVLENQNGTFTLEADGSILGENASGSYELKADGSLRAENPAGFIELQADGTVNINGVTITPAGLVTTPTGIVTPSALVNGVEVDQHNHTQPADSAGNSESPTGPMQ